MKTIIDIKCLEIKYEANNVVNKPIESVTAKPFIGPVPNINNIIDAISVVIFASNMVTIDFLKPISKACILFLSSFNSSLILSKIRTFASTAIPTVKIIPAIPGKVKVASIIVSKPININRLDIREMLATKPKNLYLISINKITREKPTIKDIIPDLIESFPRSGPTVLSSATIKGVGRAPDLSNSARSVAV